MSVKRFDPTLKYIGTGEYVPSIEKAADGEYVLYSYVSDLQRQLAEAKALLAVRIQESNEWEALARDRQEEIEAMRPVVEAAVAFVDSNRKTFADIFNAKAVLRIACAKYTGITVTDSDRRDATYFNSPDEV